MTTTTTNKFSEMNDAELIDLARVGHNEFWCSDSINARTIYNGNSAIQELNRRGWDTYESSHPNFDLNFRHRKQNTYFARTLYPSFVNHSELALNQQYPYTPYTLLNTDPQKLEDSVLNDHFQAWLKRQEDDLSFTGDWTSENLEDFLMFLEDLGEGYRGPHTHQTGMWEAPFPTPEKP